MMSAALTNPFLCLLGSRDRARTEPVTRRLIPTGRDSTIEQLLPDPPSRFHRLYLALTIYRCTSGWVWLAPHQFPRTVFAGEFAQDFISSVMRVQTGDQIFSVTDVEFALWILKDVDPIHAQKEENWLQRQGSNL